MPKSRKRASRKRTSRKRASLNKSKDHRGKKYSLDMILDQVHHLMFKECY